MVRACGADGATWRHGRDVVGRRHGVRLPTRTVVDALQLALHHQTRKCAAILLNLRVHRPSLRLIDGESNVCLQTFESRFNISAEAGRAKTFMHIGPCNPT